MWLELTFTNIISFLLFLIIFCLIYLWFNEPGNLPPTPGWRLPLIGHMHLFTTKYYEQMTNWGKSLGSVYMMYMGPHRMYVVNGFEMMKELFIKRGAEFADRPSDYFNLNILKHKGIVAANGPRWKTQRRFTLHALRDFGMGKPLIEERIITECERFETHLMEQKGQPWNAKEVFPKPICNIICLSRFYADLVAEHEKTIDENDLRDYIDAFIVERSRVQGKPEAEFFDHDQLAKSLDDLFLAGTQTTSLTLRWAVALMAAHPEVQKKVRDEIHSTIGPDKFPSTKDKSSLPLVEATLHEVQRFGSLVAVGAGNCAVQDTKINGYNVPKGTWLVPNLRGIFYDPELFNKPEQFQPERFIDEKGKAFKPDHLIPFMVGPRSCVGEALARMEIFIFFTRIVQRFDLQFGHADDKLTLKDDTFFLEPSVSSIRAIALDS